MPCVFPIPSPIPKPRPRLTLSFPHIPAAVTPRLQGEDIRLISRTHISLSRSRGRVNSVKLGGCRHRTKKADGYMSPFFCLDFLFGIPFGHRVIRLFSVISFYQLMFTYFKDILKFVCHCVSPFYDILLRSLYMLNSIYRYGLRIETNFIFLFSLR